MKRFFCNSLFYIGIVIMILLGIAVGYNIDHNFLKLYTAKMGQVPIRYCIFIIILFIDYLLFEEINHYTFIFRYKSVSNFIIKSNYVSNFTINFSSAHIHIKYKGIY